MEKLTPLELEDYTKKYEELYPYIKRHADFYSYKYRQSDKTEDLVQEGCLALVKAIRKFDPTFGVSFRNYFSWWLRFYMISYCINNMYAIPVPEDQLAKFNKYNEFKKNTDMSDEEIAEEMKMSVDRMHKIVANVYRTQNTFLEDINPSLCKTERTPEDIVDDKITHEFYMELFEEVLDPLEYIVIARHHGFIGESISLNKLRRECIRNGRVLTRERLRQKKVSAYEKLKPYLDMIVGEDR